MLGFTFLYFILVPNESPPRVVGALIGDGAGHLLPSPVRKARLSKSKQKLAEEAARVLDQVDKIDNLSHNRGKFSEYPAGNFNY